MLRRKLDTTGQVSKWRFATIKEDNNIADLERRKSDTMSQGRERVGLKYKQYF